MEKKAKSKKRREEIKPLRNVDLILKKQNVGIQVAVNSCHKTPVVKRAIYKKRQLDAVYSAFFNPLNSELNPMCCLLALLGARHFLHVSRI